MGHFTDRRESTCTSEQPLAVEAYIPRCANHSAVASTNRHHPPTSTLHARASSHTQTFSSPFHGTLLPINARAPQTQSGLSQAEGGSHESVNTQRLHVQTNTTRRFTLCAHLPAHPHTETRSTPALHGASHPVREDLQQYAAFLGRSASPMGALTHTSRVQNQTHYTRKHAACTCVPTKEGTLLGAPWDTSTHHREREHLHPKQALADGRRVPREREHTTTARTNRHHAPTYTVPTTTRSHVKTQSPAFHGTLDQTDARSPTTQAVTRNRKAGPMRAQTHNYAHKHVHTHAHTHTHTHAQRIFPLPNTPWEPTRCAETCRSMVAVSRSRRGVPCERLYPQWRRVQETNRTTARTHTKIRTHARTHVYKITISPRTP